jgi:hypothetical protein
MTKRPPCPCSRLLGALVAGTLLLTNCGQKPDGRIPGRTPPPAHGDGPQAEALPPPGLGIIAWGPRHCIPEIRNPWYVKPEQTANAPCSHEPVLGLVVGTQARAYSTNQLNAHEMVLDEVAGVPLLVTY